MKHTLSILLQNEAGALVRVAGLFAARGYNIDSLNVGATADTEVSRLTLVLQGNDASIDQVMKQARKLVDVIEAVELHPHTLLRAATEAETAVPRNGGT
jgi:acetolactate synthase-1/3 small subunit